MSSLTPQINQTSYDKDMMHRCSTQDLINHIVFEVVKRASDNNDASAISIMKVAKRNLMRMGPLSAEEVLS